MRKTLLAALVLTGAVLYGCTKPADCPTQPEPEVPQVDPVPDVCPAGCACGRTEVKPEARDYKAAYAAVGRGESVFLAVGVEPLPGDYATDGLDGVPDGRYKCWKRGDDRVMQKVVEAPATSCPTGGCPGRR